MINAKKSRVSFRVLPIPNKPKYLIFSDLDETYLPWNPTPESILSIRKLEDFFVENQEDLIFIWVSGSIFSKIFNKFTRNKLSLAPHFIASSMGTEIWQYDSISYTWSRDFYWDQKAKNALFSSDIVNEILFNLRIHNIVLKSQDVNLRWSEYKMSYHYFATSNEIKTLQDFELIRGITKDYGLNINISRCNPLIDNYENGYDIDFIPANFSKHDIVRYFLNKFDIPHDDAFAFGDSSNDLSMLRSVKNGYLVSNATVDAREQHAQVTQEPYAQGILSILSDKIKI